MNSSWDWSLDPIFGSYSLILLFACFFLLALYTLREDRPLLWHQRLTLLGLRLLAIATILLAFLRPGLTFTSQSEPEGAIGLMADSSASMNLAADTSADSRWDVEHKLWKRIQANRHRLGKDAKLIPYTYDRELRRLSDAGTETGAEEGSQLPKEATGEVTDIGKSLAQLLSTQVDPPLSAIVWMGDGTQTASPATVEPQQLARQLTQLDIPLYLIGIGPRSETGKLRDIAIDGLPEQLTVFSSNQTTVAGLLQAKGVQHRTLPVQLWIRDGKGGESMLSQQEWTPIQNDQTLPLRFDLIAPEPGAYELHMKTPVVDGELIEENNQAICFLNVRKGGARVLYLEGEPRYEQLAVRRSLEASRDFQVDFQLIYPQEWPKDITPQLRTGEFDAFLLGDLDAGALTPESLAMIAEQVDKGVGLVTMGGFHSYGPGGYANTPLAKLLPVEMEGRVKQPRNAPRVSSQHYPGPIRMKPLVANDPITTLGSPAANISYWEELKPMQGANRWSKVRNIAGVQVLLEGDKGEPMMVSGEAGKGRVLCMAFDSTWQWKLQGKADLHKKFWRQAVLFGLRTEAAEESLVVEMDKRRLYRQQSAEVKVVWTPDQANAPIPESTQLRLTQEDTDLGTILLEKRDERTLVGRMSTPKQPGLYRLKATTTGTHGQAIGAQLPFIVLDQSLETVQPMPDWSLMTQLAAINAPAGGMLVAPEELEKVFQALLSRQYKAAVAVVQSYRLGEGNIDSWFLFLVLFGLWGAQWILRKRWSLA